MHQLLEKLLLEAVPKSISTYILLVKSLYDLLKN